jgi:iron complex outermembrane receptor protein
MRRLTSTPSLSPVRLAIAMLVLQAAIAPAASQAQTTEAQQETPLPSAPAELPPVTVKAAKPSESRAHIGGFGNEPTWRQPQQAERFSDEALKNAQVQRLADLIKLDASTSASYNAAGYWDFLSVRGFVLDLTHNYRREGLPISGETSLPLDNKAGVEILKGTSGMQAGISSPGGLMNLIVKRPEGRIRTAELAFTGHRSVLTAIDLGDRFGVNQAFGLRVNAAHEHLHTAVQHSQGQRHLLALAGDWRISPDTLIEAEWEHSRRSQRSAAGFSLLGNNVPSANSIHPNINLNNQDWVKPVMMQANTGTLRLTHKLKDDWKLTGTWGEQRLKTDDRTAFPFGLYPQYLDRFSSQGEFDVYDFRSEAESRVTTALDVNASGQIRLGYATHQLTVGAQRTLVRVDVPFAAFTYAGLGNISGNFTAPASATPDTAQNLRSERSTELYLRDSIRFSEAWQAWAGLRHTRLSRAQTPSNFTQGTSFATEDLTLPWLALGYQFMPRHQAYVSWGEGVELLLAKFSSPAASYTNNSEVLRAQKSRQWEVGIKGQPDGNTDWSVNYFWTVRPEASSLPDGAGLRFAIDGNARHQGIEGRLATRIHDYGLNLSAMVMDAERRGSAKAGVNGKKPVNVPDYTLKMGNSYRVGALPGLNLQADIIHEGPRTADAVNDLRIAAWTRVDVGMSYVQRLDTARAVTWRLGVSNLLDQRAWVESPTQFDHIYLFPMAERTVTAGMQLSF